MGDGYLGKCKECTKTDNRTGSGTQKRVCVECNKNFRTTLTEVKRGGGLTCSRICFYNRLRKVIKRGKDSPNWKGDKVGRVALHQWVEQQLGKTRKCEHCGSTKEKIYDWANKSGEYKRDIGDWLRLCRKCHSKYDYKEKLFKWRQTVKKKYNWKVNL